LIQIWEDDWLYKKDIIKSIISNKLGIGKRIYARKCKVDFINNCDEFLEDNHLNVITDYDYCIGLFYDNSIVQVICFSDNFITRLCTKKNITVNGGLSKILNFYYRNFEKDLIYDFDKSFGSPSFNGFIYEEEIPIDFKYTIGNKRYSVYKENSNKIYDVGYYRYRTSKIISSNL
jgi:hypothetical protein